MGGYLIWYERPPCTRERAKAPQSRGFKSPPVQTTRQMGHSGRRFPAPGLRRCVPKIRLIIQKKRKFPTICQSQLEPEGKKVHRSSSLLSSQIVRAKFGKVCLTRVIRVVERTIG